MSEIVSKAYAELLASFIEKGDVQIKVTTGEKIHGEITEVGSDYIILTQGSKIQWVNMCNIVLVSPGVL